MSSAFLWALLPAAVGAVLLLYRRRDDTPLYLAAGLSFVLTWVAWQFPIDVVLQFGAVSFEIAPTLAFFGRSLILQDNQRTLLTFIYFAETLWLLGAFIARPGRQFAALSLIAVGLFVAALSVQPFLYAALMLAAAVLVLVPLLAPPGSSPGRGVQRLLLFQLFAVPFILFTGWLLTGVEATPGNLSLVLRAGVLLALGFSFLLALFPFHSWLPMLSQETHPYAFGFLTFFLPAISSIFLLSFIERYVWLRANPGVYELLMAAGTLGVLLGGLWAAQQRRLGRLAAFAGMVATGSLLQAISLGAAAGLQTFFALLLLQAWVLWALAVCLSTLAREAPGLNIDDAGPSLRQHPLQAAAIVACLFALAGLPLVGPFAARLAIWNGVGEQSVLLLALSLAGSLGLLSAARRVLRAWLAAPAGKPAAQSRHDFTNPYIWASFLVWAFALLVYEWLPGFQGAVGRLAAMFPQLFQ